MILIMFLGSHWTAFRFPRSLFLILYVPRERHLTLTFDSSAATDEHYTLLTSPINNIAKNVASVRLKPQPAVSTMMSYGEKQNNTDWRNSNNDNSIKPAIHIIWMPSIDWHYGGQLAPQ